MKITYYKKSGRRYVPVSEYDNEYLDSFPKGSHLVMVMPGQTSRRFNIEPALALMIAAGTYAEDAMSSALVKAGEIRMQRPDRERKLTPKQKQAWDNLVKEFGDTAKQLEWPSAREVAEEGVKAMQREAEKLLTHPMVRAAYDEFLATCKLVSENKD